MKASFSLIDELVDVVESGARRTTDIVRDLKTFAHPGQGHRSMFDVHEGLDLALNLLSNKMKQRIQLHRDYCGNGRVLCPGAQLTQVFLNLLDNAEQAINGSGSIYIATQRTDQNMTIRIRDSGDGIPEDIQGQIFDPCFTTKEVGVGTGLGLSISYSIVEAYGGSIDVASPPPNSDRGTEFTLTLPVTASKEAHQHPDSVNLETTPSATLSGRA